MRVAAGVRRAGCAAIAVASIAAAAPDSAVTRVLDDLHAAAARADENAYFALFAAGAVFLGTDASERWTIDAFRAYAHPYFARGKAWSFKGRNRRISVRGDVAWFEEDLDTPNLGPARGSGVLMRHGGDWKIEQYVLSITVPNEKMKAVKALIDAAK